MLKSGLAARRDFAAHLVFHAILVVSSRHTNGKKHRLHESDRAAIQCLGRESQGGGESAGEATVSIVLTCLPYLTTTLLT